MKNLAFHYLSEKEANVEILHVHLEEREARGAETTLTHSSYQVFECTL